LGDDKCGDSHIAGYQNGIDLSGSSTVGMTFVKANFYLKLYVLDKYKLSPPTYALFIKT
jgi:hypothetical protein